MAGPHELEDHLFRREHARIVAALTRRFGLALAEDVAQDAYCRALEVWRVHGIPDNPAAWLTTTAKRRAIDLVRRDATAQRLAPDVDPDIRREVELAFDPSAIRDEQLRMMFACCQPSLAEEVQLALVLAILCGFGAAEVAGAFLASRAAIEKRIARGKHELANHPEALDLAVAELPERGATVQRALYLLFSEGYHGSSAVRSELCAEAIRLVALLAELPKRDGAARGLAELHAIADRDRLAHYPFYAAALGELEQELGHTDTARGYFAAAHALARNDAERRFLVKRM
ncbi:MAG TPA: DUF6596 domain-containing protein [Kofleriaceae bacterium]|nr:DUF6596 domain-containing protein [Kofleriaceae bacterium]